MELVELTPILGVLFIAFVAFAVWVINEQEKKPAWKKPDWSWSITRDIVIILLLAYIGFCLSGEQTVDVGNQVWITGNVDVGNTVDVEVQNTRDFR